MPSSYSNYSPHQRSLPTTASNKKEGVTSTSGTMMSSSSSKRRKLKSNFKNNNINPSCSVSMMIIYGIACSMFVYVLVVVSLTRSMSSSSSSSSPVSSNDSSSSSGHPDHNLHRDYPRGGAAPPRQVPESASKKDPNYVPHVYSRSEWGDQHIPHRAHRGWGEGVEPQLLRKASMPQSDEDHDHHDMDAADFIHLDPDDNLDPNRPILTAFLEPMDRKTWKNKPLPVRTVTADDLTAISYPRLNSCRRLHQQFPIDDYPDDDPFLPWIHDVFPTHDGRFIQFVAQNKRRCRTGSNAAEQKILAHTEPQVALFQHVAVQRVVTTSSPSFQSDPPRYRLSDHEHADADGMETRFICRFQPSGEETLSVYNFNYEWASFRKKIRQMFHPDGRDNKQIHTSQLTFQCPVPTSLIETIRTGRSVVNDYATLFVDLIPIRTPPRYGSPAAFFPPYYQEFQATGWEVFNATLEWGDDHILPRVEDSGRWANIPICKPSLLTYGKQTKDAEALAVSATVSGSGGSSSSSISSSMSVEPVKQHHLASCLWASTGYATRGNRFAINDGQRRLLEWITYNKLIGVDHFYLYDNSGAFSADPTNSLHPIAELFPQDVTVIDWPAKVCNNNPNNVDSVGERSSQYAAEASCRLRFGPHVNWIGQFDIDEYLVPMGNNTSILPLLEQLDREGNKIVSFGSWRAWPRRRFIETPVRLSGAKNCGRNADCFQLKIPMNYTILQSYNCDRQKPGNKTQQMPAEKQIYRPDYVKHHFIHYSTVTAMSVLNKQDVINSGHEWIRGSAFPDPLSRFGDEVTEALMLHSKAVATQDTVYWETACRADYEGRASCRLGTPFPDDMTGINVTRGDDGWMFNCYVNHKIEEYWVPMLERNLNAYMPEFADRRDAEG